MKPFKYFIAALTVVLVVSTAFAASARASKSTTECGPWETCFCKSLGCFYGGQLCLSGQGITCYQAGLTEQ